MKISGFLKIDHHGDYDAYLDLANPENFDYDTLLDDVYFVIVAAAISGPDKCAQDFDYCWNVNVTGTSHFIREVIKRGKRVLFFSSDAVFGDIPGEIYTENSLTQAITPYGKMKKAIEDEFKNEALFKAIRLSYVASARDHFIKYCLDCIENGKETGKDGKDGEDREDRKAGKEAEIFHPFYRNVVTISDVAEVILYFALKWEEYEPTFLNVAGNELVSRIRIADEINRFLQKKKLDCTLKYKIITPDDSFFVNRPRITQMKSLYLSKYHILPEGSFTEKIQKELEHLEI